MLARKIVPDWTSQKQIREMIATVEVPKTPKPVEQTEALRIEAIRNVVTRDVVNSLQRAYRRFYDGHQA
jgi:hypothetical protein